MEEHISSMRVAHQRYKDGWETVLAKFSADIGQEANDWAMDLAVQSLHNITEHFIRTCEKMRADMESSPSTISAHIDENLSYLRNIHQSFQNLMTAVLARYNVAADGHQNNNLNNKLEEFILAFEYLKDFIATEVREPEVEVAPNNEVDPNATAAAPASPANAQPRDHLELSSMDQGDMESDIQHVNEANVSEEHDETVEHHKEHEETEEHYTAALPVLALPVLPDPDTNNNA